MNKRIKTLQLAAVALAGMLLLSSCGNIGQSIDPATWGYSEEVTYNALGGIINQREVRQTYYAPNSLIFEPSGTTGMLIEPVNTGYVLAGWYTAYQESTNEDGEPVYSFNAQDRWDYRQDRITEDMTLYARWVEQAQARYVDPATDEVRFTKNLTADSPMSDLSSAVLALIAKPGHTMMGYYHDEEMTEPYDFSTYEYVKLLPTDQELYDQLAEEFPENFIPTPYVSPTPEPTTADDEDADGTQITEESDLLFIRKLGYDLQADEAQRAAIRTRKNEIIEEQIQAYLENNEETTVYMRYDEGNVTLVNSADDLKNGTNYGFFDSGNGATYTLGQDIDLSGVNFSMAENFTGELDGKGFTVSNLKLTVSTSRREFATEKSGAIFGTLTDATVKDITFKDMEIVVNVPPTVKIDVAALALQAIGSTIENVTFDGLTITTGNGDNGTSEYTVSDSIAVVENSTVTNLAGQNVTVNASDSATVTQTLEPIQ